MRNATYSSSLSSSQQILTSAVDFNRARSSESTENAMNQTSKNHHSSSMSVASSSAGASFASAEGRGVPISPKKMPLTPPRDHGSPYKSAQQQHYQHQQHHAYAAPAAAAVRQPFLSSFHQDSSSSSSPSPFLRPSNSSSSSSWRNTQQDDGNNYDQVSSIFRSAPTSASAREDVDAGGFYTLQRCSAFDEDDSDSEEDECYNGMAAF